MTIAPIVQSAVVDVPPARAFSLFAELMGIALPSVYQHMYRAMRRLAELLPPHLRPDSGGE